MITINKISKSFSGERVLKEVSLSIHSGEIICIIGPSGSGKTTLLRTLNFLEPADSGQIRIDDVALDCAKAGKKEIEKLRAKTAMVFQSWNLFHNLTALQNITEGLIYAQKRPRQEAQDIAEQLLKQVGLLHKKDSYPHSLSGGQKQRIGIARALAINPAVLLLDEPTSARSLPGWYLWKTAKSLSRARRNRYLAQHSRGEPGRFWRNCTIMPEANDEQ